MSRTLSTTISNAVVLSQTAPVYLIQFGFDPVVRAATWDTNIPWNGQTWTASGIEVSKLSQQGATITMPNGEDDPWLALVTGNGVRGSEISIYEHHTDTASSPQSDAVLIFTGIMDGVNISDEIKLSVLGSAQARTFPPDSVDASVFTHLLTSGDQIEWANDTIVVN